MNALRNYPDVLAAAASYLTEEDALANLCIQVQQIASPTGAEKMRSDWVATYFKTLGLADVYQDDLHNTYGRIAGRSTEAPAVLVSAHIDTVFPFETDLTVQVDEESGHIYGPAIGDNSTGVAALLSAAEALSNLAAPPVDIWFVANSCEEGLGDLRGMRAAVDRLAATGNETGNDRIGACIVIEGTGVGRIVYQALGSRRYRISASAPGGHSWSDFGSASAIHALVQLAANLSQMSVPKSPRTTFNIGRIQGGTSINTIAQNAWLELDLRSEDPQALEAIIQQTQKIINSFQSAGWQKQKIQIDVECIGDRPTGEISADHPLVLAAGEVLEHCGIQVQHSLRMSSTDANIPLSRGIPAVCIGITQGGDAHRLSEWIDPKLMPRGVQHLILLTWWSALWVGGKLNA